MTELATKTNVSEAFSDALAAPELHEVGVSVADAILDSALEDGFLKTLPLVKYLHAALRLGKGIKDRLFLKRLISFLSPVGDVSQEQRAAMIAQIDHSGEFRVKVGEKLLYIIEKCDDHEQSEIVGRLFAACLRGELTYEEFLRGAHAVQMLLTHDLWKFVRMPMQVVQAAHAGDFISAGLLYLRDPEIKLAHKSHRGSLVDGMEPLHAEITILGTKIRKALAR